MMRLPYDIKNVLTLGNSAEKPSDWLNAVGRSIEDGDATHPYRPMQSCEENHVLATPIVTPRASTRGARF